jgi:hypothetical protein
MTTFTSTDPLKTRLLETQLETHFSKGKSLTLRDLEDLCAPLFEKIGLDNSIQAKLGEYFLRPDGYCIDAEQVLKSLDVISSIEYSDKVHRVLVKADVLPYDVNNNIDIDTDDIIFKNSMCEIHQCNDANSGHQAPIKYMITKQSLYKVLQSVTDHDRFREYFAFKYELCAIYNEYQRTYTERHLELERRRIEAVQDTLRYGVLTAMQVLENKSNGTHIIKRVGAMASALYSLHTDQNPSKTV